MTVIQNDKKLTTRKTIILRTNLQYSQKEGPWPPKQIERHGTLLYKYTNCEWNITTEHDEIFINSFEKTPQHNRTPKPEWFTVTYMKQLEFQL